MKNYFAYMLLVLSLVCSQCNKNPFDASGPEDPKDVVLVGELRFSKNGEDETEIGGTAKNVGKDTVEVRFVLITAKDSKDNEVKSFFPSYSWKTFRNSFGEEVYDCLAPGDTGVFVETVPQISPLVSKWSVSFVYEDLK